MIRLALLALFFVSAPALAAEPTYYAEIGADGTVLRVIVADAAFVAKMPGRWVETKMDGSARKNYAGPGHKYDEARDAFVPPQPYPSWKLNDATAKWEAPVKAPLVGSYKWDEATKKWIAAPGP